MTPIKWAHFGIAASQFITAAASATGLIPRWGAVITLIVGGTAHFVSGLIISTIRKNLDPKFNG